MKTIISPSLFAAQSDNFGAAVACVERGGAKYLHFDVMDGHFVPNLSFGYNILAGLRAKTALYFDAHLMIEHPERFALPFIQSGADCITMHPESKCDIEETLGICRKHGAGFGMALKPGTPLAAFSHYFPECEILLIMSIEPGFGGQSFMPVALERIAQAKRIREETRARYKISVDGGINPETGAACVAAGADILVAGTIVFNSDDPEVVMTKLTGE